MSKNDKNKKGLASLAQAEVPIEVSREPSTTVLGTAAVETFFQELAEVTGTQDLFIATQLRSEAFRTMEAVGRLMHDPLFNDLRNAEKKVAESRKIVEALRKTYLDELRSSSYYRDREEQALRCGPQWVAKLRSDMRPMLEKLVGQKAEAQVKALAEAREELAICKELTDPIRKEADDGAAIARDQFEQAEVIAKAHGFSYARKLRA